MALPTTNPGPKRRATIEEWRAAPEDARLEFLDGELLPKALPTPSHGRVQRAVGGRVGDLFDRRPGGRFPGGWWIATEVDLELDGRGFRPDLVGWRRERMPVLSDVRPVAVRPDWICEIVSRSNASHDRVTKMSAYHRAGIAHYWLLDPDEGTLVVMRLAPEGYLNVLGATRGEKVRPEPFDAVEFDVGTLLGDDPPDDAPASPPG